MVAGFFVRVELYVPEYSNFPPLERMSKRLPVMDKRLPTTSGAALPSRSALAAVHVPCI